MRAQFRFVRSTRLLLSSAGLLLGLLTSGCTVGGRVGAHAVYGYPVAEPAYIPEYIYAYPRVYYNGRYAYLVDGRWYYPSTGGWVVFREEPRELRSFRYYYRQSPRYRGPTYRYDRRPGYRETIPRRPEYGVPRERPRRRYYR